MADEDGSPPSEDAKNGQKTDPVLKDAGRSKAPVAPPREEIYMSMWASYRDGVREKRALMRGHNLGWPLVHTAIEHGWPEKGWASLRSRAELWDRQREAAKATELAKVDRKEAEAKGKAEALDWVRFKPRALRLANEGQDILEGLAAKLKDAMKAATFVRYRRVRELDVNGRAVFVDRPYVDGPAVFQAARLWASAFRETGGLIAMLTGGGGALRGQRAFPDLTEDQVLALERGDMPEGLTVEQVAEMVLTSRYGGGE
jgi:hypothetical protein